MSVAPINIRMASVRSLLVETVGSGSALGTASSFVAVHNSAHYLVTNWHVVAGRRPDSGTAISASGAVPDQLSVTHNAASQLGVWLPKTEPLYDSDGDPLWLEHPAHGRRVDVVALPIGTDADLAFYSYDPQNPGTMILFTPGADVTIIGFPFGVTVGGFLGIWVQGTVASEPDVDFSGLQCFLVDSRTRPGQSGSPVILHRIGSHLREDGGTMLGAGEVERFIGVYSGRINNDSDLGYVWKVQALLDILEGQRRGPLPTVGPPP